MRLTYKNKSGKKSEKDADTKNDDIRTKTLKQMRELRARFEKEHPELLQRIKEEVQNQPLYDHSAEKNAKKHLKNTDANEAIDKKKNLVTIMTLLETHEGSKDFQNKLKEILLDVARS